MDCLVLPVSMLRRGCFRSSHGYRTLSDDENFGHSDSVGPVKVVVGKEKREFLVDPFVLQENPFRVLIDLVTEKEKKRRRSKVIFMDVDAILFEHMLWLMQNDSSSLCELNLKEVIDFYAQDF